MAHCGLKRSRQWIIIFYSFLQTMEELFISAFVDIKSSFTYILASLDTFSIRFLLIKVPGYHFLVLKRRRSYLGMRSTWLIICLFLYLQKNIYIRFLLERHRTISKNIGRNIINCKIISGRNSRYWDLWLVRQGKCKRYVGRKHLIRCTPGKHSF